MNNTQPIPKRWGRWKFFWFPDLDVNGPLRHLPCGHLEVEYPVYGYPLKNPSLRGCIAKNVRTYVTRISIIIYITNASEMYIP